MFPDSSTPAPETGWPRRGLAPEEEVRRLVARELHDELGQLITYMRFALSDIERSSNTSAGFCDALRRCRLTLDEMLDSVRSIAMGLRPSVLDYLGVAAGRLKIVQVPQPCDGSPGSLFAALR